MAIDPCPAFRTHSSPAMRESQVVCIRIGLWKTRSPQDSLPRYPSGTLLAALRMLRSTEMMETQAKHTAYYYILGKHYRAGRTVIVPQLGLYGFLPSRGPP